MSNNNLQTDQKDSKQIHVHDAIASFNHQSSSVELTTSEMYDKQQSLAEIANNTFRELSNTLEIEQTKLLELEDRRIKLQEEMLSLKAEIEKERESYKMNIVQSVADNLSSLNKVCNDEASNCVDYVEQLEKHNDISDNQKELNTCCEFDEDTIITARNTGVKICRELMYDEPNSEEKNPHTSVKNELQCFVGQRIDITKQSLTDFKPQQE